MANMLITKHKKYDLASPIEKMNAAAPSEPEVKIVIDPQQGDEMVLKLLTLQLEHLRDLATSWDRRNSSSESTSPARTDFAPKYFTIASRDLHRAVEWFVYLREHDL